MNIENKLAQVDFRPIKSVYDWPCCSALILSCRYLYGLICFFRVQRIWASDEIWTFSADLLITSCKKHAVCAEYWFESCCTDGRPLEQLAVIDHYQTWLVTRIDLWPHSCCLPSLSFMRLETRDRRRVPGDTWLSRARPVKGFRLVIYPVSNSATRRGDALAIPKQLLVMVDGCFDDFRAEWFRLSTDGNYSKGCSSSYEGKGVCLLVLKSLAVIMVPCVSRTLVTLLRQWSCCG